MRWSVVVAALGLGACAYGGPPVEGIAPAGETRAPTPAAFEVCYANGCREQKHVGLSAAEWAPVARLFARAPETAGEERERIARAVQLIEVAVGRKTGLDADRPGSFAGVGRVNQQDCVDEMTNVATDLRMLEAAGFLKDHRLGRNLTSFFFGPRGPWPHTVATIVDTATGDEYVIDSWMQPFGALPYVMPVKDWEAGKALASAF